MLTITGHDEVLVKMVRSQMNEAVARSNSPTTVVKRIASYATRLRNRRRVAAIRKHPFKGVCEASGRPLRRENAVLDEVESERGYVGRVRWVCQKANNSGKHSCGGC